MAPLAVMGPLNPWRLPVARVTTGVVWSALQLHAQVLVRTPDPCPYRTTSRVHEPRSPISSLRPIEVPVEVPVEGQMANIETPELLRTPKRAPGVPNCANANHIAVYLLRRSP